VQMFNVHATSTISSLVRVMQVTCTLLFVTLARAFVHGRERVLDECQTCPHHTYSKREHGGDVDPHKLPTTC
jgi:hypothetical protein